MKGGLFVFNIFVRNTGLMFCSHDKKNYTLFLYGAEVAGMDFIGASGLF